MIRGFATKNIPHGTKNERAKSLLPLDRRREKTSSTMMATFGMNIMINGMLTRITDRLIVLSFLSLSHGHVPLHVQGEVVRSREGPLAHSALERPVSGVFPHVPGELV